MGVLERWLEAVLDTPGMTGLSDRSAARRMLVDDALRAEGLLAKHPGPVVDVGSGGGSPGIPLAAVHPDRPFTLVEAERRKAEFLERTAVDLPNVTVVWGRAEEQPTDAFGVALAKALAKPPVAAELCLPLVRVDGIAILWVGETADHAAIATAAAAVGGALENDPSGLVVVRKVRPTPAGFPRRVGVAKKRPLA